jgi:hypothetical protein
VLGDERASSSSTAGEGSASCGPSRRSLSHVEEVLVNTTKVCA